MEMADASVDNLVDPGTLVPAAHQYWGILDMRSLVLGHAVGALGLVALVVVAGWMNSGSSSILLGFAFSLTVAIATVGAAALGVRRAGASSNVGALRLGLIVGLIVAGWLGPPLYWVAAVLPYFDRSVGPPPGVMSEDSAATWLALRLIDSFWNVDLTFASVVVASMIAALAAMYCRRPAEAQPASTDIVVSEGSALLASCLVLFVTSYDVVRAFGTFSVLRNEAAANYNSALASPVDSMELYLLIHGLMFMIVSIYSLAALRNDRVLGVRSTWSLGALIIPLIAWQVSAVVEARLHVEAVMFLMFLSTAAGIVVYGRNYQAPRPATAVAKVDLVQSMAECLTIWACVVAFRSPNLGLVAASQVGALAWIGPLTGALSERARPTWEGAGRAFLTLAIDHGFGMLNALLFGIVWYGLRRAARMLTRRGAPAA